MTFGVLTYFRFIRFMALIQNGYIIKLALKWAICLLFHSTAFSQLSGTYSVGVSGDYPTLTDAVADLNSLGVSGPVVFNVEAGGYDEVIIFDNVAGTSPTNTVTIQSEDLDSTAVAYGYYDGPYVIAIINSSYIHLRHITINRSGDCERALFLDDGASNNTFSNCIFSGPPDIFDVLIEIDYSSGTINDNLIENNRFVEGGTSIVADGSFLDKGTGNDVIGNIFEGFGRQAIHYENQADFVFRDNSVRDNKIDGAFWLEDCGGPALIERNRIEISSSSSFLGIDLDNFYGTLSDPLIMRNNFLWCDSPGSTTMTVNLNIQESEYVRIYNNSFHQTGLNNLDMVQITGSSTEDIELVNNIFRTLGGRFYEFWTLVDTSEVYSDYNAFYTLSSDHFEYDDGFFYTFEEWKDSIGLDLNSVWAEPNFVSDTNLHVINSPTINGAGVVLPEVSLDIDLEARDIINPDIGADEFDIDSTTYEDIAYVAMANPDTSLCDLDDSIAIFIVNKSNFDVDSLVIKWSMFGIVRDSSWYYTVLPAGDTVEVFLGTFPFVKNTYYELGFDLYYPNGFEDDNILDNSAVDIYYYLENIEIFSKSNSCNSDIELYVKDFPRESLLWSTGDTDKSTTVSGTGTYDVIITDYKGCIYNPTISIE